MAVTLKIDENLLPPFQELLTPSLNRIQGFSMLFGKGSKRGLRIDGASE